jgi:hypothetical protein
VRGLYTWERLDEFPLRRARLTVGRGRAESLSPAGGGRGAVSTATSQQVAAWVK